MGTGTSENNPRVPPEKKMRCISSTHSRKQTVDFHPVCETRDERIVDSRLILAGQCASTISNRLYRVLIRVSPHAVFRGTRVRFDCTLQDNINNNNKTKRNSTPKNDSPSMQRARPSMALRPRLLSTQRRVFLTFFICDDIELMPFGPPRLARASEIRWQEMARTWWPLVTSGQRHPIGRTVVVMATTMAPPPPRTATGFEWNPQLAGLSLHSGAQFRNAH